MSRANVSELRSLPVDKLRPDPQNAKEHTEEQIGQIVASIQSFGFSDPIGVVPMPGEAGAYLIVEGHGRTEAAKRLGLTEVPCLMLPAMTAAERKAYAIAHNQTQQITGLDTAIVYDELGRLDVGKDEHMSLGFTDEDILFMDVQHAQAPEPPAAEPGAETPAETATPSAGSGPASGESSQWQGLIQPVHSTVLRFDNREDLAAFTRFLDSLTMRYPLEFNAAGRLSRFAEEFGLDL